MNMLSTPIREAQPSAIEVLSRLKAAHAMMGFSGKINLTYSVGAEVECYATHWFRPDQYAHDDCRAIAAGTLSDCLTAVERYAAAHAQQEAA